MVIVEDEIRIAKDLQWLCKEILGQKLKEIAICSTLEEANAFLQEKSLDLLLLDLNLNGADGFELLQSFTAGSFHTIIVSAYDNRAIQAFEYGVLDFVPKPFSQQRLKKALSRYFDHTKTTNTTRFLSVKSSGQIKPINLTDLLYIKGSGVYTELHLLNGQQFIHDKTLEKLMAILPQKFERIHRSYIVRMDYLDKILIHEGSKYEMVLKTGLILPIGRTRYPRIKEKWLK